MALYKVFEIDGSKKHDKGRIVEKEIDMPEPVPPLMVFNLNKLADQLISKGIVKKEDIETNIYGGVE